MKKIIISNYDDIKNPYYAGGGARAIHETAKRLKKYFDVTVVTGSYPGSRNATIDGVKYRRIGVKFGGPKVGQLLFQFAILKAVKNFEFDAWLENVTPPFSASLLPLVCKKPVIGLVHMLSGKDMKRKYKLPFDLVEAKGLSFYRHLIATQSESAKVLKRINPKAKIYVIPNGVEVSPKFRKTSKKHILYLGRIEVDQKGLDLLIHAFAQNKNSSPLVIAGSGEDKQKMLLKSLIKKHNLSRHIKLVGRVEGVKKQQLIDEAYCVVVPSRFETFSLTALEAMASNVPVVCFDIPGLKWIPKNAAVKIRPFSVTKLADELLKIVSSKKLQINLGRSGYNFAKKMDWESVSDKYVHVLKNI